MKKLFYILLLMLFFTGKIFADCQGCCSHHGGVVCVNSVTRCGDGSSLSPTCFSKGCNKCGSSSKKGSCFIETIFINQEDVSAGVVTTIIYFYNSSGKLDRVELADGTVEHYIYSEDFLSEIQYRVGEKVRDIKRFTYHHGLLSDEKLDYDNDGSVDEHTKYTYLDGRLLKTESNLGWSEEYIYEGDRLSRKVRNTGGPNEIKRYIYDAGNLTETRIDLEDDGFSDEINRRTHDSSGRLIKLTRDVHGDGTVDESIRYEYAGNQKITKYDRDNDGTPDWIAIANYLSK